MPSFSLLVGRGACIGHGLAARLQRRGLRGLLATAGAGVHRAAPLASRICALTAAGAMLPQVPPTLAWTVLKPMLARAAGAAATTELRIALNVIA